jgi:hypothetical protein
MSMFMKENCGIPVSAVVNDTVIKYSKPMVNSISFPTCFSVVYDITPIFNEDGDRLIDTLIPMATNTLSLKIVYYNLPFFDGRSFLVFTSTEKELKDAEDAFTAAEETIRNSGFDIEDRLEWEERLFLLFMFYNNNTKRQFLDGVYNMSEWNEIYRNPKEIKDITNIITPEDFEFDMARFRLNDEYGQIMFYQHVTDIRNSMNYANVQDVSEKCGIAVEIQTSLNGEKMLSAIFLHMAPTLQDLETQNRRITAKFKKEKTIVSPYNYKQKDGLAMLSPTGMPVLAIAKTV